MELLLAALIFYFVIKYAVREAIIEARVHESELSLQVRINDLIEKITIDAHEMISKTKSKDFREKIKEINNDCSKISISDSTDEEKLRQLILKKSQLAILKGERLDIE